MRRHRNQKKKQRQEQRKERELLKSNSSITLLNHEGEIVCKCEKFNFASSRETHGYVGEVVLQTDSYRPSEMNNFHIFAKAQEKDSKGTRAILFRHVRLEHVEYKTYKATALGACPVFEVDKPEKKIKRLIEADKKSEKAHEAFGWARETKDITRGAPTIIPPHEKRWDNISTVIKYRKGPSEEVDFLEPKAWDLPEKINGYPKQHKD